ncbi:MAG: ATP synthase F0 subunit A [Bdellovibrionales bacterium CG10_big_fil_rev_8_21_14_0_10_45_34]|nr:MAG: ATP synthase F0 subunit A [Bdellovibrionales bacterium CG10_big_fil_rev_8_21_14_0_10_45_34]
MAHFSWAQLIPGVDHHNLHVATAVVGTGVIVAFGLIGRMALGTIEKANTPSPRLTVRGFFELLTEFIVKLSDSIIGPSQRKLVPLFGALFTFIWFHNMFGLIPGVVPATDNLNTTLAMGIFSFVVYNYLGLKENGFAYLKHFAGPVLFLAPLMIVVELISHLVRPVSLGLRLMANMVGDHNLLAVFHDLFPIGLPVFAYGLGLFVCFMQALVFTLMSMVYVSMAVAHEH